MPSSNHVQLQPLRVIGARETTLVGKTRVLALALHEVLGVRVGRVKKVQKESAATIAAP